MGISADLVEPPLENVLKVRELVTLELVVEQRINKPDTWHLEVSVISGRLGV